MDADKIESAKIDTDSFFEIPRRAFLDTNVVNITLDHSDQIHDHQPLPECLSANRRSDVEALCGIFDTGQRAGWEFVVSPLTYQEVSSTANPIRRDNLESWFAELWYCWSESVSRNNQMPSILEIEQSRLEIMQSGVLRALPDSEDRLLIADAIAYRCDCFCTCDYRTVINHRDELAELPIQILTPTEWWRIILPWAPTWL